MLLLSFWFKLWVFTIWSRNVFFTKLLITYISHAGITRSHAGEGWDNQQKLKKKICKIVVQCASSIVCNNSHLCDMLDNKNTESKVIFWCLHWFSIPCSLIYYSITFSNISLSSKSSKFFLSPFLIHHCFHLLLDAPICSVKIDLRCVFREI